MLQQNIAISSRPVSAIKYQQSIMGGASGVKDKKRTNVFDQSDFFIYIIIKNIHTIFILATDIWHYNTLQ